MAPVVFSYRDYRSSSLHLCSKKFRLRKGVFVYEALAINANTLDKFQFVSTVIAHRLVDERVTLPPLKSRNEYLALVGGTIYVSPTEDPIRDGVVLINDGKVAAVGSRVTVKVPQTAQLLDCSGHTITAGFWNSHVHFMERKWAAVANIP